MEMKIRGGCDLPKVTQLVNTPEWGFEPRAVQPWSILCRQDTLLPSFF